MSKIKKSLPIILILLFSLVLRIPLLNSSFWLDEAAQALEIIRPTSQQLELTKDFQPPLLHLILHFAFLIFNSKAEWVLRLIGALIPGLITIWATYKIGEKIVSKKVGLTAALLLSTNSLHIFYSQELRPYSLPAMFATLSWLTLLKFQIPSAKFQANHKYPISNIQNFTIHHLLFTILTSLGLYSSYLYPFLILSQLVYVLLLNRKLFKSFVLSTSFSVLCFLPWLPMFLQQLKTGTSWQVNIPGWASVVGTPQLKALPLVFGKFIFGVLDLQLNLFFLVASLLIIGLLAFQAFKLFKQKKFSIIHSPLSIILIWFFIPLITSWLISFVVPVLQPKRVLYLLPAFYLAIAYLCLGKQTSKKESLSLAPSLSPALAQVTPITLMTLMTLMTLNIYSTYRYFTDSKLQRENWSGLYAQISQQFNPSNTIVVFAFDEPFAPWTWYNQAQFASTTTYSLNTSELDEQDVITVLFPITDYKNVLIFDYLRDLTDTDDKVLSAVQTYGFTEVRALDGKQIGFVRVYNRFSELNPNNCSLQ